jgi:hypothetical protein
MLLALIMLLPTGLEAQMPPQPGKLVIYSVPEGAVVTINSQEQQQHTNATFIVSPGNYQVSVTNSNPALNCPSKPVSVSAGQTISLTCTSGGWK